MRSKTIALLVLLGAVLMLCGGCTLFGVDGNDDGGGDSGPTPGTVLFFDDFEDGDDGWVSNKDYWHTSDEKYTFTRPHLGGDTAYTYVLAGQDWSSYTIEADIWVRGSKRGIGFIFYAQEDLSTMIIVWATTNEIWWEVHSGDEIIYESDPVTPGLFQEVTQHVQVVLSGNTYKYVVDGLERSSFTNTYFTTGMPGLAGWNGSVVIWPYPFFVDNFRVTAAE